MPEAVPPARAGVAARVLLGKHEVVGKLLQVDAEVVVILLGLGLRLLDGGAVAVQLRLDLSRGDHLGQHPGERVDLVAAQLRARGEARRLPGQDPLEPEHQCVADLPAVGRLGRTCVHLGERIVERPPPGGPGGEYEVGVFLRVEKRFPGPGFGAESGGAEAVNLRR